MKKLLIRIIGIALLICGISANAGNNFNALDRNFASDYIVNTAIGLVADTSLVTLFGYSANTANVPNGSNPTITIPTGVVITEKLTVSFMITSVSTTGIDISVGTSGVLVKNP